MKTDLVGLQVFYLLSFEKHAEDVDGSRDVQDKAFWEGYTLKG